MSFELARRCSGRGSSSIARHIRGEAGGSWIFERAILTVELGSRNYAGGGGRERVFDTCVQLNGEIITWQKKKKGK